MDNNEYIEEAIDLEAIGKQYEEKGIFARLGTLCGGITKPKNTREYKEARIELQRLAAPIIAESSAAASEFLELPREVRKIGWSEGERMPAASVEFFFAARERMESSAA